MRRLLENIILYRLWRLRRLLLLSVGLPVVGLLGVAVVYGPAGTLWQARAPLLVVVIWAVVAVLHVLRYPRATGNPLTFGAASAVLVLLTPVGDWLFAQVQGPVDTRHWLGLALLALVGWLVAAMLFEAALVWLVKTGRKRNVRLRTVSYSTLPAAHVLPLLMPRPNTANALRRHGPVEANGQFAVWEQAMAQDEPTADTPMPGASADPWAKTQDRQPDYWVTEVRQTDPTRYTALYATADGGTEAVVINAMPHSGGSVIMQESLSDVLTTPALVLRYLTDLGTDLAMADTDMLEGRARPRAICLQPADYPGKTLVRALKAQDPVGFP